MKIFSRVKKLASKLYHSFERFPISLSFAILVTITVIAMNHSYYDNYDYYSRMAMTLALGIPLSLSAYLYFEKKTGIRKNVQILIHLLLMLVLALYYFLLLNNLGMVETTRYTAYSLSLYLLFSFIPYLPKKERYELYVIRLFNRFVITYLYSIILYLGIAAILGTINLLFNTNISGTFFFDMAIVVAGVFAPAFFLADIPRQGEEILVQSYPKVLGVLLQYIILPLLSIYTIILYVYFAKILIIMELPQGIIGNLVLWYSIISAIILFFIYPLTNGNQWVKSFIRFFPKIIIPLLAMMFVAMGVRINAYGVTESRYFVLLVGLWVTGVMVYYAFKTNVNNIIITMSLAIIGVLAVTGPWNAYSVSQRSQNNRLEKILLAYGMIDQNSQIQDPEKDLEQKDKYEISQIILYFDENHNIANIRHLPENFEIEDMKKVFGFELINDRGGYHRQKEYFAHYVDRENSFLDIKGYDYFIEYANFNQIRSHQIDGEFVISYNDKQDLMVEHNGKLVYKKNLEEVAIKIHQENMGEYNPPMDRMIYVDETEDIKLYMAFRDISGFRNMITNKISVDGIQCNILIKIK